MATEAWNVLFEVSDRVTVDAAPKGGAANVSGATTTNNNNTPNTPQPTHKNTAQPPPTNGRDQSNEEGGGRARIIRSRKLCTTFCADFHVVLTVR